MASAGLAGKRDLVVHVLAAGLTRLSLVQVQAHSICKPCRAGNHHDGCSRGPGCGRLVWIYMYVA